MPAGSRARRCQSRSHSSLTVVPHAFPATRWSLIARLPERPHEVSTLLGLYADAIGAYLQTKLGDERAERIDDVIQAVLLDLLRRPEVLARAQPGSGSRFRHFVMHLAWQSARDHLRRLRRGDQPGLAGYDPVAPMTEDQTAVMDRAWAVAVLQHVMDEAKIAAADGRLDPEAHAVMADHLIDGRALRAIAAARQLSLATSSRRLAEGRRFVQQAIAERLRLAGECTEGESAELAGARLLAALRD